MDHCNRQKSKFLDLLTRLTRGSIGRVDITVVKHNRCGPL